MIICVKDKGALLWIWGGTHGWVILCWNTIREGKSTFNSCNSLEITFCWDRFCSGSELLMCVTCDHTLGEQRVINNNKINLSYGLAVPVSLIHRIQWSGTPFLQGTNLGYLMEKHADSSQNSLSTNHLPFSTEVLVWSNTITPSNIGSGNGGSPPCCSPHPGNL